MASVPVVASCDSASGAVSPVSWLSSLCGSSAAIAPISSSAGSLTIVAGVVSTDCDSFSNIMALPPPWSWADRSLPIRPVRLGCEVTLRRAGLAIEVAHGLDHPVGAAPIRPQHSIHGQHEHLIARGQQERARQLRARHIGV